MTMMRMLWDSISLNGWGKSLLSLYTTFVAKVTIRYYYAIVTCDTSDAASHIYNELEGTELERSANVFDMSFVPDGMSFDGEPR